MKIFGIVLAAFSILIGFRLLVTALQAAVSGKILVRQGRMRAKWQPAPTMGEVWKVAVRDGLMGLMLIALGVALIT
jgi:hypothetical protein